MSSSRLFSLLADWVRMTLDIATIERLPIAAHMPEDTKYLRQNSPEFIAAVLERTRAMTELHEITTLDNDNVSPLAGGMLSSCYLVALEEESVVIKLRYKGVEAEAEALEAWQKAGAAVVTVKGYGIVPGTRESANPIKYLILEAVIDSEGAAAETSLLYARRHPERVYRLGELLGQELAKMHKATTERKSFGEYGDMWGNPAPFRSWNSYLMGYLEIHQAYIKELGFQAEQIGAAQAVIQKMRFSTTGRYIHGDFSLRNAVITRKRPLALKIFDPNPLIGDPSWDIAILYNNEEYARRKLYHLPSDVKAQAIYRRERDVLAGMVDAYELATGKPIDQAKVAVSQLMQTLFLVQLAARRVKSQGGDPTTSVDVLVREEVIREKLVALLNRLP